MRNKESEADFPKFLSTPTDIVPKNMTINILMVCFQIKTLFCYFKKIRNAVKIQKTAQFVQNNSEFLEN